MAEECGPGSVRELEIWRAGIDLVKQIYVLAQEWPREEAYGLTSQAKRAALSIPTNLAEGVGRGSPREAARYAQIALGSVYELDTLLHVSSEVGVARREAVQPLREKLSSLARRISSFICYQNRRPDRR